ncbi:MAG TPA: 2,3-bisphosphoglycerate-independent phosphoglycerate mutase [Rhizomicrobium sp.]|jgi:2,3-bisphosphoglycerate-independent phosphoglycerate mutase|nr:2,3-bisphosphoglycerate-independent phosphoglycerate mutase [Rhizomicrobium sp.]
MDRKRRDSYLARMSSRAIPKSARKARGGSRRPRPAVLCILDGWGARPDAEDNAITRADPENYLQILRECPNSLLETSGRAVGLPAGQMGNSEVGHMNIGAGRIVVQDLPRIDDALADHSFASRPALLELIAKTKKAKGTVHLAGLVSPGGVHSHQDHMVALARVFEAAGLRTQIHAFLDGRDTPPRSAQGYLHFFESALAALKHARIATVAGRYYAMDRDRRWDRVQKAYDTMVSAAGPRKKTAEEAIADSYRNNIGDEFVLPVAIGDYRGMKDGDAFVFANFRADRARELATALLDPKFDGFKRRKVVKFSYACGMTEYSKPLKAFMSAIFPPETIRKTIGEVVAEHGLRQLHVAETEKYAHVTFFLNGGREKPYRGEDRILVPSPKVATYDLQPEMSAFEVTERLEAAILSGKYDFIVVNYANPDMVGHTGILAAAEEAVKAIDACLGRLYGAVKKAGGVLVITADHGNVEMMRDPETGEPHTAHTTFDVPLIVAGAGPLRVSGGRLADVAPTLLDLMRIEKPHEMAGHSLIVRQVSRVGMRV